MILGIQVQPLTPKKANGNNGKKAGMDFNQHNYVGKRESKHFNIPGILM
jgi:hypothetical protein